MQFGVEHLALGLDPLQALGFQVAHELIEDELDTFDRRLVPFGLLQLGDGDLTVVQDGEETLDGIGGSRLHQFQFLFGGAAAERVKFCHQAQEFVLALGFLGFRIGRFGLRFLGFRLGFGRLFLGLFDLLGQLFHFLQDLRKVLGFSIFFLFLCHGAVISCQTRPCRNPGKAARELIK